MTHPDNNQTRNIWRNKFVKEKSIWLAKAKDQSYTIVVKPGRIYYRGNRGHLTAAEIGDNFLVIRRRRQLTYPR